MNNDPFSYAEWFNPNLVHLPTYISIKYGTNISNSVWDNLALEPVTLHNHECAVAIFNTLRTSLNMKRIPCDQHIPYSFAICEAEIPDKLHSNNSNTGQSNSVGHSYVLNSTRLIVNMCQYANIINQVYSYCIAEVDRSFCQRATMNNTCLDFLLQNKYLCLPHQFMYYDGMCISLNHVCDGESDCTQHEDENDQCNEVACFVGAEMFSYHYCTDQCLMKDNCICKNSYFQCQSGGCIHGNNFCDRKQDCKDNSDENNCAYANCNQSEFSCDNMECIPLSWRCNTFIDCSDGSDEFQCFTHRLHAPMQQSVDGNPVLVRCGEDYSAFIDVSSMCILLYDHYGLIMGCANGWHLQNCSEFLCIGYFKCTDSYCIPVSYICDGKNDCANREDEIACEKYICPGLYRCKGTTLCISQSKVCDSKFDCPGNDDEDYCYRHLCPENCICNNYYIHCIDRALLNIPSAMTSQLYITFKGNNLQLENITLHSHYKLKILDISFNNINALPFNCFHSLESLVELNISNNNLRHLDLFNKTHLKSIDISHNHVRHLNGRLFANTPNIKRIDISNNRIETIGEHILSYIHLRLLNIRLNAISVDSIDIIAFQLVHNIEMLYTDDQHICCYVPHYGSCVAPTQVWVSCGHLIDNAFLRSLFWIFGASSTITNALSIFIQTNSYMLKKRNIALIIVNLHFSEMCMGIYLLVISLIDYLSSGSYYTYHLTWSEGITCKALRILHMYWMQNATTLVMFLALLRFVVIVVSPMKAIIISRGKILTILFTISLYNIIMCIIPIQLGYEGPNYARSGLCILLRMNSKHNDSRNFLTIFYLSSSTICLLIAGVAYVLIFRSVYKTQSRSKRKKKRLPWLSLLILCNSIGCLPFWIVTVLDIIGMPLHVNIFPWMVVLNIPLTSILNPFIYTLREGLHDRVCTVIKAVWSR